MSVSLSSSVLSSGAAVCHPCGLCPPFMSHSPADEYLGHFWAVFSPPLATLLGAPWAASGRALWPVRQGRRPVFLRANTTGTGRAVAVVTRPPRHPRVPAHLHPLQPLARSDISRLPGAGHEVVSRGDGMWRFPLASALERVSCFLFQDTPTPVFWSLASLFRGFPERLCIF